MGSRKKKVSPKNTKNDSPSSTRVAVIIAIIGLVGTLGAAYISYLSTRSQVELPILATRTADALQTSIAMTTQAYLPGLANTPPALTTTPTFISTSAPTPTLTVESQLVQLIDNYYTCINVANPDIASDYEKCWNLLSDRPGEFQDNFNRSNAGFGLETFISFWKDYKATYALYFCPKGSEKVVDAQYDLYKRSDLSISVGKYFLEYSFGLDSKGWRIKAANSISGIGSYCEGQPRIEKLTLIP